MRKILLLISSKKEALLILIILTALFLFLLPYINNSSPTSDDAQVYISLGANIVTGHGYGISPGRPHTYYPFLFPLMLGGIIHYLGFDFYMMRLMNVLLLLLSLAGVYNLIKSRADKFTAYLVLLLTASSAFLLDYLFYIYSEAAYLFFSILGLIFAEKYLSSKKTFSKALVPCVLFLLCSFFTRVVGLSLIMAALLFCLSERRAVDDRALSLRKALLLASLTLPPVFLWFLRAYNIEGGFKNGSLYYLFSPASALNYFYPTYTAIKPGLFQALIRNSYGMIFCGFPSMLSNIKFDHRSVPGFLLSMIMLWGLAERIIKKRTIVEYYFLAYLCALSFWLTTYFSKRVLVPIAPFIFYYFIMGVSGIFKALGRRPDQIAVNQGVSRA
jgi:hypothetical protein